MPTKDTKYTKVGYGVIKVVDLLQLLCVSATSRKIVNFSCPFVGTVGGPTATLAAFCQART